LGNSQEKAAKLKQGPLSRFAALVDMNNKATSFRETGLLGETGCRVTGDY